MGLRFVWNVTLVITAISGSVCATLVQKICIAEAAFIATINIKTSGNGRSELIINLTLAKVSGFQTICSQLKARKECKILLSAHLVKTVIFFTKEDAWLHVTVPARHAWLKILEVNASNASHRNKDSSKVLKMINAFHALRIAAFVRLARRMKLISLTYISTFPLQLMQNIQPTV